VKTLFFLNPFPSTINVYYAIHPVPVYASHCDNSQNTLFPSFLQHHNYADGRLAVLIELNEYVTLVLNKLDLIATDLHEDSPHSPHLLPLAAEHPARNPDNNTQRTALGGRLHNHLNLAVNTGNGGVGSAMARKVGESAFSAVPPQVLVLLLFHTMNLCHFPIRTCKCFVRD